MLKMLEIVTYIILFGIIYLTIITPLLICFCKPYRKYIEKQLYNKLT